jgi:hypothetical protein
MLTHKKLLAENNMGHHVKRKRYHFVLYDEQGQPVIKYNIKKKYIAELEDKLDQGKIKKN